MDAELIQAVRRFNRVVTQRVGALNDSYLARERSLGESRVLWEIAETGTDVRTLRSTLDLDSGYLSRLLRSLESAGLITVEPSSGDGRVRTARPTDRGAAERAILDDRSDELATSMLEPLTGEQRERLVAAMGEVERLLTATLVEVAAVDPGEARPQQCIAAYFAELDQRFGDGFDPSLSIRADVDDLRPPRGLFLLATLRGEAVGCGALKLHGSAGADLKRMWVARSARGLGLGRRLLGELERRAAAAGAEVLRLETNRSLTEAIALYRSAGYREVEPFNDEPYADHWFEKDLAHTIDGGRPRARA